MADQLQVLQQMREMQQEILSIMVEQKKTIQEQINMSEKIRDAITDGRSFNDMADKAFEIRDAFKAAGEAGKSSLQSTEMMASSLGKEIMGATGATSMFSAALGLVYKSIPYMLVTGFFEGVMDSINTLHVSVASLIGLLTQAGVSIVKIGIGIASIPFRIFGNMIKLAGELAEAYAHITRRFEEFRKEFGAFYNQAGLALQSSLDLARQMEGLAGLGFHSVFEDTAAAIDFFQDQFKALGPLFDFFGAEIGSMADKFVHFVKGMGLSSEQLKILASRAKATGQTLEESLGEISNVTLQMADTFGISNKLLARDVADMVGDVASFGNTSVKSLTATAVRVRSLGLEVKTLSKIIDKFMNFEDAAKNASMLSQSFGVNLDALGLMNAAAKDQGKVLDQLRNAMFAAGRDATKMSTAELRLLAQTTGLSEEEARLAFAMENRGKSLDEIKRKADQAENKELSQAEAMQKLADAIERVVRVFKHESFFGAFITGFQRGVKTAAPFIDTLFNLQAALDATMFAGMEVGRIFVEKFPGVLDMLKAMSGTFNADVYKKFAENVVNAFSTLFDEISTLDPATAMKNFWKNLLGSFNIVTDAQENNLWIPLQEGFIKFLTSLSNIFVGTVPLIKDKLVEGLVFITKILTDGFDEALKGSLTDMTSGTQSFILTLFNNVIKPMGNALSEAWKSKELQAALSDLGMALVWKLGDVMVWIGKWIMNNPKLVMGFVGGLAALITGAGVASAISGALFGLGGLIVSSLGGILSLIGTLASPAVIGMAAAGIAGFLMTAFSAALTLFLGGKVLSQGQKDMESGILSVFTNMFNNILEPVLTAGRDAFAQFGEVFTKLMAGTLENADMEKLGQNVGAMLKEGVIAGVKLMVSLAGTALLGIIAYGPQVASQIASWFVKGLSYMSSFISGILSQIPIIGSVISIPFDLMSAGFENLSNVLQSASDTWGAMRDGLISGMDTLSTIFSKFASTVTFALSTVFSTIYGFGTKVISVITRAFSDVGKAISSPLNSAIDGVKKFLGDGSATNLLGGEIGTSMSEGILSGISEGLPSFSDMLTNIMPEKDVLSGAEKGISSLFSGAVTDINNINKAIAQVPEVDVPIRVDKVGNALGLKNNQLKVESGPLNITLNLQVVFEADKVADVLLDTRKIMPK